MKERVVGILFLLALTLVPLAAAQSIDAPIRKIAYHAEQYEAGNINYAQLMVYIHSLSKDIAQEMGAVSREHEPTLKAEQLRSALGEPTESTRWAWFEGGNGEGYDKRLENEAPAWRKIIFDGKKMQIWLAAWPSIRMLDNQEAVFYRLHLDTIFKSPQDTIDVESKISEIRLMAEQYSQSPTLTALESLAKESVAVEQSFSEQYRQNPAQCTQVMNGLFGSENKRDNQKKIAQEIVFYEGENFEALLRLEMCDECDWHWIDMGLRFESRGRFNYPEDSRAYEPGSPERYKGYSFEQFKEQTRQLIAAMKSNIEGGNYELATKSMQELRILNEAWNEKSNNVWEEVDKEYRLDFGSMTHEERNKCNEEYCWIKKEQEKRKAIQARMYANYAQRREFYLSLFSDYEKKERYAQEEMWEKRLVEQFREFGEELCTNNVDDNKNDQVDCAESQCSGKVCGYGTLNVTRDNATLQERMPLYCIAGTCQAREETAAQQVVAVCGNNLCEEGEVVSCSQDCAVCPHFEPIICDGEVLFSGEDANKCPLEPVCVSRNLTCQTDNDCADPLCADAACVEGLCQITQLTECREAECVDGDEKVQACTSGESRVTATCSEGLWVETGIACVDLVEDLVSNESEGVEQEGESEEGIVRNECIVKGNCGNENDVCSNGKCVSIPPVVRDEDPEVEPEERQDEPADSASTGVEESEESAAQETSEDQIPLSGQEHEPQAGITGEIVRSVKLFTGRVVGLVISGFDVEGERTDDSSASEEGAPGEEASSDEQQDQDSEQEIQQPPHEGEFTGDTQINPDESEEQEQRERQREEREREQRENEEQERRESACSERCDRECHDRQIRPCVEKCILDACGQELDCTLDEERAACESSCRERNDLSACTSDCSDKCLAGKDTWVEPQRQEHKEEKFVFTVGGACRMERGRTEGNIWFGGWGNELKDFHRVKEKYYKGGSRDWCKENFDSVVRERRELEQSLNGEFASWFFERYVANAADDWENHISGIFQLYWKDVELSRQTTQMLECLGRDSLPEHTLINFKYETDYGSVEFWEEVKTLPLEKEAPARSIISPYMRIWLFPSRKFFLSELNRSMHEHRLPGSSESHGSGLSEEKKAELTTDEEFMKEVRDFNGKYGENLAIQFKDLSTGEVVFNVYIRINEEEGMYVEPMPVAQLPPGVVTVTLDVDKLLDIVEYEESGRVELESPPWDRQPRTTFVKGAVDGVRMYLMFNSLMNSAVAAPQSAQSSTEFFVKKFFEIVMGDEGNEEREDGPRDENEQDEQRADDE